MKISETVQQTIRRFSMLSAGDRVLCALSGGGDSVCMTHLLASLAKELSITVAAAHFSHGLRPEKAEEERRLCAALCDSLQIPLFCGAGDTRAYAAAHHLGAEEAARALRYAFLEDTARTWRADRIATAHQQSDNGETLLLNLLRGCGMAGLAGIPPVRGTLIRPLLACGRREIEAYNAVHGLSYATDESNLDGSNARSRLRTQVMPLLRELNPQADAHLAAAAELAQRQNEWQRAQAGILSDSAVFVDGGWQIDIEGLLSLSEDGAAQAMQQLQRRCGGEMLSRRQIEGIFSLCRGGSPSGEISLPGGMAARRRYGALSFEPGLRQTPPPSVTDIWKGSARFGGWEITVLPPGSPQPAPCPMERRWRFSQTEVQPPLSIRSRADGDRITRPCGEKSVKKVLMEHKIPKNLRDSVPIICDNKRILAVGDLCAAALPHPPVTPEWIIICRRTKQ